jgi:hypothetical protein
MLRTTTFGLSVLALIGLLGLPLAGGEEPVKEDAGKAAAPAAPAAKAGGGETTAVRAPEAPGCPGAEGEHRMRIAGFQKQVGGAVGLLAALGVAGLGGLSLFAFLALLLVTFPATVKRVREGSEARPWFAPFLGGVNALFAGLLVAALAQTGNGIAGIAGIAVIVAFAGVAVLGISGKAQTLGARVLAIAERRPNPVANLAIGWPMLFLVGIIPVVGWVLLAYWTVSGVGGVLVTLFGKSKPGTPPTGQAPDRIIVDAPKYTV